MADEVQEEVARRQSGAAGDVIDDLKRERDEARAEAAALRGALDGLIGCMGADPKMDGSFRNVCIKDRRDINEHYKAARTALATDAGRKALDAMKLAVKALEGFRAEEWTLKADWLGLCSMRRHEIRCQGTNGRNAPVGPPSPTPHDERCPYRGLSTALAALRDVGVEP